MNYFLLFLFTLVYFHFNVYLWNLLQFYPDDTNKKKEWRNQLTLKRMLFLVTVGWIATPFMFLFLALTFFAAVVRDNWDSP